MVEQPLLVPINEREFQLLTRYKYNGIEIPEGFVTDLASVPRVAWSFIPRDGLHNAAALVHDYLYQHRGLVEGFYEPKKNLRKKADDWFKSLMLEAGCSPLKVNLMYWSVRMFGWAAW